MRTERHAMQRSSAMLARWHTVHFTYSHRFHVNDFCWYRCGITVRVMERWQPHASSVFEQHGNVAVGGIASQQKVHRFNSSVPGLFCAEFACSSCDCVLATVGNPSFLPHIDKVL